MLKLSRFMAAALQQRDPFMDFDCVETNVSHFISGSSKYNTT